MKRPSVKWLAVAAAGCIFASSMGTYTYTALADEFVYTDANVSITSIVDHYIEENGGDVFTADATPEDATAPAAVVAEATATDAVATGEIQEIAKVRHRQRKSQRQKHLYRNHLRRQHHRLWISQERQSSQHLVP